MIIIIIIIVKSRKRVSRERSCAKFCSFENLACSYTEYGINGIQGTSRILDPTQTSERKFRPRFLVEFSLPLSLSLVPGRKRTIEEGARLTGVRLTGRRPTNSGIKRRFIYLRYRYRSTDRGGEKWDDPVRFFLAKVEEKTGISSFRSARFSSLREEKSLHVEIVELRENLFFFFFLSLDFYTREFNPSFNPIVLSIVEDLIRMDAEQK